MSPVEGHGELLKSRPWAKETMEPEGVDVIGVEGSGGVDGVPSILVRGLSLIPENGLEDPPPSCAQEKEQKWAGGQVKSMRNLLAYAEQMPIRHRSGIKG